MKTFHVIGDDISDGYHTFEELYRFRLLFNASLFNEWARQGYFGVHKSRYHHDGNFPFGDPGWFIVMAELSTGQISNHYQIEYWDLFKVPERDVSNDYDGHTPADVVDRLERFIRMSSSTWTPGVRDESDRRG